MYKEFYFKGGVYHRPDRINEKFLLFAIVNGKEIPLYTLVRDNLIWKEDLFHYRTKFDIVKIFMGTGAGFGVKREYYSFYLRLKDPVDRYPTVTIYPLSRNYYNTEFRFFAKANFLKKSEVLKVLNKDSGSIPYVKRQALPARHVLDRIVEVDKQEIQEDVRKIHIS